MRKGRATGEVDRWKATEFRTFLLYTGPVILRGKVNDVVYKYFVQFPLTGKSDRLRGSSFEVFCQTFWKFVWEANDYICPCVDLSRKPNSNVWTTPQFSGISFRKFSTMLEENDSKTMVSTSTGKAF